MFQMIYFYVSLQLALLIFTCLPTSDPGATAKNMRIWGSSKRRITTNTGSERWWDQERMGWFYWPCCCSSQIIAWSDISSIGRAVRMHPLNVKLLNIMVWHLLFFGMLAAVAELLKEKKNWMHGSGKWDWIQAWALWLYGESSREC